MTDPKWGVFPEAAIRRLREREWDNRQRLKSRLKGDKPFPLRINLKPPNGQDALTDLDYFHRYVNSWRKFSNQACVNWETRNYRQLPLQSIPVRLVINDVSSLAGILGEFEQQVLDDWQSKISQILAQPFVQKPAQKKELFSVLIDHLDDIEAFSDRDIKLLISLIPQLVSGMGEGRYLRALPVTFVDTKFVEKNFRLIERIADVIHCGHVQQSGGLLPWLNCQENPKGWLFVRPLCARTQKALGDLPLIQLATDTLLCFELPARHVIVVENVQSGLALPPLENSIAVFGGGKNVSWLAAKWLTSKRVAYWGDIDSEGLAILSDARSKLPSITALMMDEPTVTKYQDRMVGEPDSVVGDPIELTQSELSLFHNLRSGKYGNRRLEQERVSVDYVCRSLDAWINKAD